MNSHFMYKHLFFDLDNTLWDFSRNSHQALLQTFRFFGLHEAVFPSFYESYVRNNDRLWEAYRNGQITKEQLSAQRFGLTFFEIGINDVDNEQFNKTYLEYMPQQTHLCPGALEVVEKLSLHHKLHIITNGFSEVQYKKMKNSGLSKYFSGVFISEEIKAPKPSPEIFLYALKNSNARKDESLMIGDSWEVDIVGAMQVGIDQIFYAPESETEDFTGEEKAAMANSSTRTYRIKKLAELPAIIRSY